MWPGVTKDVGKMVRISSYSDYRTVLNYNYVVQIQSCGNCQHTGRKLSTAAPELHPVSVVSPWYHIGIDFIGPISPTSTQGNSYILTISDYFTKFVEGIPLSNKYASGVAAALYKVQLYNRDNS